MLFLGKWFGVVVLFFLFATNLFFFHTLSSCGATLGPLPRSEGVRREFTLVPYYEYCLPSAGSPVLCDGALVPCID